MAEENFVNKKWTIKEGNLEGKIKMLSKKMSKYKLLFSWVF